MYTCGSCLNEGARGIGDSEGTADGECEVAASGRGHGAGAKVMDGGAEPDVDAASEWDEGGERDGEVDAADADECDTEVDGETEGDWGLMPIGRRSKMAKRTGREMWMVMWVVKEMLTLKWMES